MLGEYLQFITEDDKWLIDVIIEELENQCLEHEYILNHDLIESIKHEWRW